MGQGSIFHNEWRSSLRAQYQHVVRKGDKITLPSLTAVLQQVGFSEDELRQLRLAATLHVDEVAEDFEPDLAILADDQSAGAHPAECLCPDCAPIDESRFDADGQTLPPDPEAAAHKSGLLVPAVALEPDEAEPVTFADSLEPPPIGDYVVPASAGDVDVKDDADEEDAEGASEDESAPPDEPAAPKQSSLF